MNNDSYDEPTQALCHAESIADIEALDPTTSSVLVHGLDDLKAAALTRLLYLTTVYTDGHNRLTDAGLAVLAGIKSLRVLDLEFSQITDVGVRLLGNAQHMKWLDLGGCAGVSADTVAWLRRQLPDCEIEPR